MAQSLIHQRIGGPAVLEICCSGFWVLGFGALRVRLKCARRMELVDLHLPCSIAGTKKCAIDLDCQKVLLGARLAHALAFLAAAALNVTSTQ